jgi:hypothetical protein
MTNQPFTWKCSYMGATDFACHVAGWPQTVTLHRTPSNYELSIINPTWLEHRLASVNTLTATCSVGPQVTPEIVAAFNAWASRVHAEAMASMRAQPERYGPADELHDEPPAPALGAYFDHDASRYNVFHAAA